MKKVVMYTTKFCPYCMMARKFLSTKNIPFEDIAVDGKPDLRREMTEKAEGRYTVPQIFIGDTPIGGFDDMYQLEQQGKLDALIES